MPRPTPIYSDFFWKPLTQDVEQLLGLLQHHDSVRYAHFSSVWRELGFSHVFSGIPRTGEMKRFCRVAFSTAARYFLPPFNYQVRVGGLYLLYAFYHTQLSVPPIKIRLPLKDWQHVCKFMADSVSGQHYDVVYILQKLLATKAFHFTAMPHFLTFRKQRKQKVEPLCAQFLGRTMRVQDLVSSELLEETTNIQKLYGRLKDGVESCPLAVVLPDLRPRLDHVAAEFVAWQNHTFQAESQEENSGPEGEGDETGRRARLLSSIKQKSYSSIQKASRSRRHRQAGPVETSGPDMERKQEEASIRHPRPPSLRARTWEKLRVQEESSFQSWLLSVPEQERSVQKRIRRGTSTS